MGAHVVVAGNPAASGAGGGAVAEESVRRLKDAGHEVTELDEGDAPALERAVRQAVLVERVEAVVVVGGDGTVHAVVNALARSGVPLGIVPAGSGNDLARSLDLPHDDPAAAIDHILTSLETGRTRDVDAVRISAGRWYAGVLSVGFDAAVTARARRIRRLKGRSRYVVAVLLELRRLRPHRYRMTIDRDARQVDAVLLSVANTVYVGAGMRLVPSAVPDDGLLDVIVATPLSRRALLRIFPRVFEGTHVLDEHVAVERGRVVTIDVADRVQPQPVAYADGEPIGPLPLTLEVVPGALQVL